jgi:hypothetical protein
MTAASRHWPGESRQRSALALRPKNLAPPGRPQRPGDQGAAGAIGILLSNPTRGRDGGAAGRGDDGHAPANEISHQRRQLIELVVQPVVLYGYISILMYPVSPRPLRNAVRARCEAAADLALTNANVGTDCCALARNAHAAVPPIPR